ncbi:hypothetical protein AAF712_005139 [Marasmius tenuissimus]|uniref:Uncharacterized protein n=1 Tax=Marasmius tenuissimus TaxID=585030 RepID=A0ABR3A2W9_9AGAR
MYCLLSPLSPSIYQRLHYPLPQPVRQKLDQWEMNGIAAFWLEDFVALVRPSGIKALHPSVLSSESSPSRNSHKKLPTRIITITMKFLAVLTVFALAGIAAAEPIERRACAPTGCVCNGIRGQFCGNQAVNPACTNGHVFECSNTDSHACDYGIRDSCQKCGKLQC